jgi:hypothetical protein
VNLDGCPDIYVANDFQESDFLYRNNCDGTFTESMATSIGHTSRFSMGVDAADFNNDGRPDIVSLDMLPEREDILKTSANAESFNVERLKLKAGYHPQYARNALQLNRGNGRFSEIGYLAGVAATDWSWSALFADLDNDGNKDLFITNGIYRRPNDLDYINYVGNEAIQALLARGPNEKENTALLSHMPQIPLASFAFRNNGNLTFTNVAEAWGLADPSFSNGAAYVDLNNSGSLDLVVNRVNAPAAIYRSRARERNANHYLTVALRGSGANSAGIGAKVMIKHRGVEQMLEQMPTRGFQSSVDPRLHFGLGAATSIDSLIVIWPDHRFQVMTNVAADRMITLAQQDAAGRYVYREGPAARPFFADVTARTGVDFRHVENTFFDYNREPLMPHLLSTEGPALGVGDVDGDGLDDFYIGGAKWQAGRLYVQRRDGTFRVGSESSGAFAADSLAEDVDATFFDADGDRDLDLYVVSGGNEFAGNDDALRDRLYLNDGRGKFTRADAGTLPDFFHNGSCVVPADFDRDGDVDLFVGSRVVARAYGLAPRSYLLANDGSGRFTDVTAEKAPALSDMGMVTSAAWTDYDGDTHLDLVVVGEWMPVTVLRQEGGRFVDATEKAGLAGTNGWWNSVTTAELDGDGRQDLILGNLGLNSYLRASREEPARLYVHDFFQNGALEQILTFYRKGVSYPLAGRDELVRLMPQLRSKYVSYRSFGASRINDILPAADLREAKVLEARVFATSIALTQRTARYHVYALPTEAQFAPVYAAVTGGFSGDGDEDILLGGNFHGVTPVRGRYDASFGLLLRVRRPGQFTPFDMEESNLVIDGQVRKMKRLRTANPNGLIVVARNNDQVQILQPLRAPARFLRSLPGRR